MQDNTNNMAPVPAPKGSNGKFYAIIAIMGVIIVGLAVAVVVLALPKESSDGGSDVATDCKEEVQKVTDQYNKEKLESLKQLQLSQRDVQREDDLSRFITAANSFQSNNTGATPWRDGGTDINFVHRYVDETCNTLPRVTAYAEYNCSGSQFKDPDGENYKIQYVGSMLETNGGGSAFNGNLETLMEQWPNNHALVVATGAACGSEGKMKQGTGERQYAIAYRLENGSIACQDNH